MRWFDNGRAGLPPEVTSSMVHLWTFDEAAATDSALDLLGVDTLTDSGSPASAIAPVGYSRVFDGSDDYFAGAGDGADEAALASGDFALQLMFKMSAVPAAGGDAIAYYGEFGVAQYCVLYMTEDMQIRVDSSNTIDETFDGYTFEVGQWYVVGINANAGDLFLYVNGQLVQTNACGSAPAAGNSSQWILGTVSGGGNWFTGSLCWLAFYDATQTAARFETDFRRAAGLEHLSVSRAKVTVTDSASAEQDLLSYSGNGWLDSVEIIDSADQRILQATLSIYRNVWEQSLSLWHDNRANRTAASAAAIGPDDTTYGNPNAATPTELLTLQRTVKVYAVQWPMDLATTSATFSLFFSGKIDAVDWGDELIKVRCSDLGGGLRDAYIETEIPITTLTTQDLEAHVQDALNYADDVGRAWIPAAPTVWVPVATSTEFTAFAQERAPLLQTLCNWADMIGWVLRYRWRPSTAAFELALFEPRRTVTTGDHVIDVEDYSRLSSISVDVANIRNAVRVVAPSNVTGSATYAGGGGGVAGDGTTGTPAWVLVLADGSDISTDSITKYGRRYCEICEGSTLHLKAFDDMEKLALAVLRDLCEPTAELALDFAQARPQVEVYDSLLIKANGIHSTADFVQGVYSATHRWNADGSSATTIQTRGKPSSGSQVHLARETRRGLPSGADTRASARATRNYRDRDLLRDQMMQAGLLRRGRDARLANGDFEYWSWGGTVEPDGWTMTTGTWGSDASRESTNFKSGTYGLKFSASSKVLKSDLFSVEEGEVLGLRTRSKVELAGGGLLEVSVDFYQSDRTTLVDNVASHTITDSTNWTYDSGYAAAPANARWAKVVLTSSADTDHEVYLDKVEVTQQSLWCKGYRTADQAVTTGADRKIELNTERDPFGVFDAATNYEFNADRDGRYSIAVHVEVTDASASSAVLILYKNDAAWKYSDIKTLVASGSGSPHYGGSGYEAWFDLVISGVELVVNDNIELYILVNSDLTVEGGEDRCFMRVKLEDET